MMNALSVADLTPAQRAELLARRSRPRLCQVCGEPIEAPRQNQKVHTGPCEHVWRIKRQKERRAQT